MKERVIEINLDEKDVLRFLNSWDFETDVLIEKEIIREVVRKTKLEEFDDLVHLLAISRPGPLSLGTSEEFIKRKRINKKVQYEHPILKEILEGTYGLILYHEQIEEIIRKFGGFSKEEAISMRRSLGKKSKNMESIKKEFMERALNNGFKGDFIERLYEKLKNYAAYVCSKKAFYNIGIILYIQAYLRVKYKKYFNPEK